MLDSVPGLRHLHEAEQHHAFCVSPGGGRAPTLPPVLAALSSPYILRLLLVLPQLPWASDTAASLTMNS